MKLASAAEAIPELIDIDELSARIGVAKATIYQWVHRREETGIPHYKIGRLVRFDPLEIQAWLARKHRGERVVRFPKGK
jgi:excisionase family DNA binding protein